MDKLQFLVLIYSIHRLTYTNLRQLLSRSISDSVDKAIHLGDKDSSHNSELSSERYAIRNVLSHTSISIHISYRVHSMR